jgi:predicted Zn-dependent protease
MTFIPSPDLFALSVEDLIDEAGKLDSHVKALTKKLDEAKAIIKAKVGEEAFGNSYRVQITSSHRWTLDQTALKEEFGEDWFTSRSKITTVKTLLIKPYVSLGEIKVA